MGRYEEFTAFMDKYANVSYMKDNVPRILENLKKADEDGCLQRFFLNDKPYQSVFTFFVFNGTHMAARGKDQVAIVFALNLYGVKYPGFAAKVNALLKELVDGSSKKVQSVIVLMRAQMELQQKEISLINFVDRELLLKVNSTIHRLKGPNLALTLCCLFGGAIGMPGFTIIGWIPLTFVAIAVFIYGFVKTSYWLGIRKIPEEHIASSAQSVGECL